MATPSRSPVPCNGDISLFHAIPYLFFPNDSNQSPNPLTGDQDNILRFWIHIGLVSFGLVLATISFLARQWRPLPYGKHSDSNGACTLPLRPSYIITHLIPGVVFFTITYFTGLHFRSPINITLLVLFEVHYLTRGFITPLVSRYSESKLTIWVPLHNLLLNVFFHYVNAEFIGSVDYCRGYHYDPRFIIGAILFVVGFVVNRVSDTQLVFLRKSRRDQAYYIPRGFVFGLVSSPHYLGEGLMWLGWAVMTWSLAGLVWWLYVESVFLPRARHTHKWYKNQFLNYPSRRKALVPFLF